MIIDKNDKKNKYKALCFTHKNDRNHKRMNKNINPIDSRPCNVSRYPIEDSRKKFSDKEWKGLRIHKKDKYLIKKIKRRKAIVISLKKSKQEMVWPYK